MQRVFPTMQVSGVRNSTASALDANTNMLVARFILVSFNIIVEGYRRLFYSNTLKHSQKLSKLAKTVFRGENSYAKDFKINGRENILCKALFESKAILMSL